MAMTSKQWTWVGMVSAALLLGLAMFGGTYRALGTLFLPLIWWVMLKREPEQAEMRPMIRVLGWLFVALAVLTLLAVGGLIFLRTEARRNPAKHLPQSIEEYRAALGQPDFGMFFADYSQVLPVPNHELTVDNARLHLDKFLGRRSANMDAGKSFGDLISAYSAVARKRVSYGRAWLGVTNDIPFDDAIPRTRRESLDRMEGILRAQGGFIFPLDRTNVVLLTAKELRGLGHPIPTSKGAQP